MLLNSITLFGASLAVVAAETIHGVVLVNRHGDRMPSPCHQTVDGSLTIYKAPQNIILTTN